MGTVGVIHQLARVPDGSVRLMVQGLERIRLLDWVSAEPYLVARIEPAPEQADRGRRTVDALRRALVDIFGRMVAVSPELPDELAAAVANVTDPRHVAYLIASVVPLDVAVRQEILELDPVTAKLRRLIDLLQRELAVRELGRKITTDTEERLSKKQREFYLREQLRSIQRELGRGRGRRHAGRRAAPADRGGRPARGGPARGGARAGPARRHPAGLARARHDRHVPRVDGEPALEQAGRRDHRHPAGRARSSTRTTSTSRRSRTASSSTWPSRSSARSARQRAGLVPTRRSPPSRRA